MALLFYRRSHPIHLIIFFLLFSPTSLFSKNPKFEFGIKCSYLTGFIGYNVPIGYFNFTNFYEPYWGLSGELLFSPINNFYLRWEIFEIRSFIHRSYLPNPTGGWGINFLQGLETDFLYYLPLRNRFLPFIYGGINYEDYAKNPDTDIRGLMTPYEIRAGIGLNYQDKSGVRTFLETQIFHECYVSERVAGEAGSVFSLWYIGWGFHKISFGFRLPFGSK